MKTYTRTITETLPKLHISYDEYPESPREWDNLGYFITCDSRYNSPDKNETLENIVRETGQEATDVLDHMEKIKKSIERDTQHKVIEIYTINKYEHSGRIYSVGIEHGFDHALAGFYIVTDKTREILGTPRHRFEDVIKAELEAYNAYINGEVYAFALYDDDGGVIDSCGGFYDIEDIRDHLPEEWEKEDLQEYFNIR